jgi:hypothetical protein
MKKDIKDKWVEKLRSGDLPQVRGAFTDYVRVVGEDGTEDVALGYCCLAVLTTIAVEEGVEDIRWPDHRASPERAIDDREVMDYEAVATDEFGTNWVECDDSDLPEPVARWAGLISPEGNPWGDPLLDNVSAITRNDGEKHSFEDIAAAIERDPAL